jgi:hypothetical protein
MYLLYKKYVVESFCDKAILAKNFGFQITMHLDEFGKIRLLPEENTRFKAYKLLTYKIN